MLRTWFVRLPASVLTLSVRSFHVPATSGTWAWPPLGAHLLRHARDFAGEDGEPVHHAVDDLLDLEDLAACVDGDLAGEVAARDGGGDGAHVAQLHGEVAGQLVHVVGQVAPGAGD